MALRVDIYIKPHNSMDWVLNVPYPSKFLVAHVANVAYVSHFLAQTLEGLVAHVANVAFIASL